MSASRAVLVVDDEPHIARLVAVLAGPGWRVQAAENAETALARLDDTPYDVILCDVSMPDARGAGV